MGRLTEPICLRNIMGLVQGGGLGQEEQAAGEEEPPKRPPLTDAEKVDIHFYIIYGPLLTRGTFAGTPVALHMAAHYSQWL